MSPKPNSSPPQTPPPNPSNTSTPNNPTPHRIKIKNRRKRYLDRHPSYFSSPHLELADPLLHDRLIRQFQTPAERAADAATKGYAGVLEADLVRSEARMEALHHAGKGPRVVGYRYSPGSANGHGARDGDHRGGDIPNDDDDGDVDLDDPPTTRAQGSRLWKRIMEHRFLAGADADFASYAAVDAGLGDGGVEDEEEEEREELERWFGNEEERWVGERRDGGEEGEVVLSGETGVQDF